MRRWPGPQGAKFEHKADGGQILARGCPAIEITLAFAPQDLAKTDLPAFSAVRQAAADSWSKFWLGGGAVDLSQSKDPRWKELERRIVLSQYLTAIQCCGSLPPQETGLVQNSWFGKFHLEMHWWHAAHFALWGRPELLERSLDWYRKILPGRADARPAERLCRGPLAEDGRARRRRQPQLGRRVPHLAAAASDLLRRTALQEQYQPNQ